MTQRSTRSGKKRTIEEVEKNEEKGKEKKQKKEEAKSPEPQYQFEKGCEKSAQKFLKGQKKIYH